MQRISKHITYREAVRSHEARRRGIDNTPSPEQLERMRYVAEHCFEPAREWLGARVYIASFLRVPELNKAIGGSPTSFHPLGAAIDGDADPFGEITNRQLFLAIIEKSEFTELIYEYPGEDLGDCEWVHMACVKGREHEHKIKIKYPGQPYRLMTTEELQKIYNYGRL